MDSKMRERRKIANVVLAIAFFVSMVLTALWGIRERFVESFLCLGTAIIVAISWIFVRLVIYMDKRFEQIERRIEELKGDGTKIEGKG